MATPPNVRLDLPSRPENVLLVRESLTGLAEAAGIAGADLSDVRTAATEAANNVVLHAYPGGEGPMEVEIDIAEGFLSVCVRDHGVGLPREAELQDGEGIGLPVIRALTHRVDFMQTPGGGAEVRMEFATPGVRDLPAGEASEVDLLADLEGGENAVGVSIAPPALARPVLPRLLTVLAARAHFSTDRISDIVLLADALVAQGAGSLSGSELRLSVSVEPRVIGLHLGPLRSGRAGELLSDSEVQGLGPILAKLADAHEVLARDSHDVLTLQLQDRR